MRTILLSILLAMTLAVPAHAVIIGTLDHFKCYKAKDPTTKTTYTADLQSPATVLPKESGCQIRLPAKIVCDSVGATFDPPPTTSHPGLPLAELLVCYKLKCPKERITFDATDEFGTRSVTVSAPRYLCAPANVGAD